MEKTTTGDLLSPHDTSLVIGPGGILFWYMAGMLYERIQQHPCYMDHFDTVIGYSGGSLLGGLVLSGCDLHEMFEKSMTWFEEFLVRNPTKNSLFELMTNISHIQTFLLESIFPPDAYRKCNERLHVVAFDITNRKVVCFHKFDSNEDLIHKIFYGCNFPFITKLKNFYTPSSSSLEEDDESVQIMVDYMDAAYVNPIGVPGCCEGTKVEVLYHRQVTAGDMKKDAWSLSIPDKDSVKKLFYDGIQEEKRLKTGKYDEIRNGRVQNDHRSR
jgi:predicted acylesterase/phospholipase RssA